MSEYKYNGIELTPNIFAELLILLFDGKQFKRATAIEEIITYHQKNGGLLGKREYISVFKKACQNLSKSGLHNVGYGTWRLNYKTQDIEIVEEEVKDTVIYTPDKTVGSGEKSVYVYYYDTYKKYAESNGQKVWECKIGRTDKDPLQRVFGQTGTCYPQHPHLALIIKCDNSYTLELALHSILEIRGRWIADAPGTEWYLTSPTEIESIYNLIIGDNS